jgi:methylmalonyl-CoA mutase cobalamin-binding subunit
LLLALAPAAWSRATYARPARAESGHSTKRVASKATGKVVIFPIRDDDDHSMTAQLERMLRSRGFEVVTGVRPVDTAEQYRELATTLNLAALVGGTYQEGEKDATLTIQVLRGYTGRRMVVASFKQAKYHLRAQVEEKLWGRIGPAVTRACADASRPRRRGRGPLVIDAGTSLASSGESAIP